MVWAIRREGVPNTCVAGQEWGWGRAEAQAGKLVPGQSYCALVQCIHSGDLWVTGRGLATVTCVEQRWSRPH